MYSWSMKNNVYFFYINVDTTMNLMNIQEFGKTENTISNNFKIRLNSAHMSPSKYGQAVYATKCWDMHSAQWLNCMNGQTHVQCTVAKLREWTNCTVHVGPSKVDKLREWLNVHNISGSHFKRKNVDVRVRRCIQTFPK